MGKVGRHAQGVPAHTWVTTLLQWGALLLYVAYLVSTSVGGLTPMASRVILWASAKSALSIVIMARLAWTGRRQAQRLWVSMQVLICRQGLCTRPATNSAIAEQPRNHNKYPPPTFQTGFHQSPANLCVLQACYWSLSVFKRGTPG